MRPARDGYRTGTDIGAPARTPELNSGVLPGNVHADDWIMLGFALLAVGLLGYLVLNEPSHQVGLWIFYADCAVAVVFAVEFLWRWRKRRWDRRFLARNWYELFAMIPVAHPAMVPHRFLTAVLLLVRLGRAADRAMGEQFFYRLADRFSEPIVHAVKKPITVAVLDEVVKVLETGNYPDNLAKSLTENKAELRAIIHEKITEDEQLGRIKHIPFHGEIVQAVIDAAFRVVLEVLHDPRIDDFFASVVRDNREQIRRAVVLGLNEADSVDSERLLPTRMQRSAAREFDQQHGLGH
jgi:voltage-gated potassium channel